VKYLAAEFSANFLGILAEIYYASDDDTPTFERIKNSVGKSWDEQTPISFVENGCDFRKCAKSSKRGIQVPHENLTPAWLEIFIKRESLLNVSICRK
jgi:hypothetical protein